MPQFQRKVAAEVQSRPPAAQASQTWVLMPRMGGGPSNKTTHTASMAVPTRMV